MTKKLGLFAVAMMNIVIVANLQMITATAVYGYSLIIFYLLATILFFVPCMLIISQLSTAYPITGGSYLWVEKAFGKHWGFFTATLVWLSNVIWYPTIFSLLATIFAQLISPHLADSTMYILGSALVLFWAVTIFNIFGIRVSSFVSSLSSVIGVILPTLILIIFAVIWMMGSKPSQITFSWHSLLPELGNYTKWAFLTQIIIGLVGIEMSAVHAGDIQEAKRTIPRAMGFSAIIILLIVILAPLSIGLVIPQDKISIVAGLIDALQIFFQSFQLAPVIFLTMMALIFVGNIGSTTAWMIGSTRGMHVASIHCNMPSFFQKTNRHHAPLGILILEAIIFTFSCSLFFFSTISNAYWILLQLASQITLIYYMMIFAAAMKLKNQLASHTEAFQIPGKTKGITLAAIVASITALFALILGFVPPSAGTVHAPHFYSLLLILGIGVAIAVPFLFLKLARRKQ